MTISLLERLNAIAVDARRAYRVLAESSNDTRTLALVKAAASIRDRAATILLANAKDTGEARKLNLSPALLDRLTLNDIRIEAMATGLETVAALPDPLHRTLAEWTRPNDLRIRRVAVPLGVIAVIYESRPNVTADAAALCLKAGNAVILRGGSESFHSNAAIADAMNEGICAAGLPEACVQRVPSRDREAVGILLGMTGLIDVVIPRGGKSLTERVMGESRVPTLLHLDGNCHVYLHAGAEPEMAERIVLNAKLRRTGICGAAESLLIDRAVLATVWPRVAKTLLDQGCEIRGDEETCLTDPRIVPATDDDWNTEYLDAILSVKVVENVEEAISHINLHGSHHTDAIITNDETAAERFLSGVDSAIVLHNASTQFADGGEFGMGAEIGIATGRLHARGPVGAEQLTTHAYKVYGSGQCRA